MATDLTPEHTARRHGNNEKLHPEVAAAYRYVEKVLDSADIPSSKLGGPLWFGWALREAFLAGCSHSRAALVQPETKRLTVQGCNDMRKHGENYIYESRDGKEIQLDGWFTREDLMELTNTQPTTH
jgi:hypothetical protein